MVLLSEKLYLPISVLLSALIISGTVFFVGASINDNLTGLSVLQAAPTGNTGNTGNTAPPANNPITPPPEGKVSMAPLLEGARLVYGKENAKVKIVEFSDFECPFCGRALPTITALVQKYGDDVAVYYRHFPLSFHPNARPAALAAECAAEQGKFTEFHDKLFANQQALSNADLKKYAGDLGLDTAKFNQCLDSSQYASKVDSDFSLGSQTGVSGTPTFFINGAKLVGAQPQASFEPIIDAELA